MNKEDLEAIEFWKDCIKHLEKEFQYPNYLGYFITIRDKECEYLKTTLNLIDKLQQKVNQLETNRDEVIQCIKNFDVFKEFSFPLMKRDEENQVKSSIDYEFKTTLYKQLLEILERGKE